MTEPTSHRRAEQGPQRTKGGHFGPNGQYWKWQFGFVTGGNLTVRPRCLACAQAGAEFFFKSGHNTRTEFSQLRVRERSLRALEFRSNHQGIFSGRDLAAAKEAPSASHSEKSLSTAG